MWREFVQMLESFAALTAVQVEIVAGAELAFSKVHACLVEEHD
jgi:heme oxygenase